MSSRLCSAFVEVSCVDVVVHYERNRSCWTRLRAVNPINLLIKVSNSNRFVYDIQIVRNIYVCKFLNAPIRVTILETRASVEMFVFIDTSFTPPSYIIFSPRQSSLHSRAEVSIQISRLHTLFLRSIACALALKVARAENVSVKYNIRTCSGSCNAIWV